MFSTAMKAPRSAPSTIIQVVKLALSAESRGPAIASNTAMMHAFPPALSVDHRGPHLAGARGWHLGVDGRCNGHAGPEVAAERIVGIDSDPHRDALHDLGEVPGGVVWREQGKFLPAGR